MDVNMEDWPGNMFTKRWVVKYCHVGKRCWCRIIETVDGEEVIGTGQVDDVMAGYLARLQNWAMSVKDVTETMKMVDNPEWREAMDYLKNSKGGKF